MKEMFNSLKSSSGAAKILVMDDDEAVRDNFCYMLEKIKFSAQSVRDGNEAIRVYDEARRDKRPFDIVIMDLRIKCGAGALETISKLSVIDPEAKIILSSVFCDHPAMVNPRGYGFKASLPKPYTIEELSRVLECAMSDSKKREPQF